MNIYLPLLYQALKIKTLFELYVANICHQFYINKFLFLEHFTESLSKITTNSTAELMRTSITVDQGWLLYLCKIENASVFVYLKYSCSLKANSQVISLYHPKTARYKIVKVIDGKHSVYCNVLFELVCLTA